MTRSSPDVAGLPRDAEGSPVFNEPWEAQAFAMAIELYEAGVFSWPEWSERLAQEIQGAQAAGDPDLVTRRIIRRTRLQRLITTSRARRRIY